LTNDKDHQGSHEMTIRTSKQLTLAAALLAGLCVFQAPAQAGSEPFIGEISWVGATFCPLGWAEANGQLLPISEYDALFSLIGTIYGGDGESTFALPDLRGRSMVHAGTAPGLSAVEMGQRGGDEQRTLTVAQMPSHSHTATTTVSDLEVTSTLYGSAASANSTSPAGAALATTKKSSAVYAAGTPDQAMASGSVKTTITGGDAATTVEATSSGTSPVSVRDPYVGLKACIALFGVFPSRP
jgi:microcystin-dependent protein